MNTVVAAAALHTSWAEETLQKMSLEEKVGQLFIAPACPQRGDDHRKDLRFLIDNYHIGGIILKAGTSESQVALINELSSAIPLLRLADAEWGVSMRLTDAVKFPRNLTLGAIQDLSLLSRFGKQIGWEGAQVGNDIHLGPVADVNTNPKNPIIGTRSFGQDPQEVALRASLVAEAMQEEGTWACGKHFPGHGDTDVDSHVDLPVITHMELSPFEAMVQAGVKCIMTAHLLFKGQVVTFSPEIVGILRKWKFEGLIITDALNMKALTNYHKVDEIALKALQAGHDILLYGDHISDVVDSLIRHDIPCAIEAIKQAVHSGAFSEKTLDEHVLRILKAKEERGLKREFPKPAELITPDAIALKKELFRHAVTLVSNSLLPLKEDDDTVPVVKIYEITDETKAYVDKLRAENTPHILVLFTSPYKLLSLGVSPTTIVAYENDPDAEKAVKDVIFGRLEAKGMLPIKLEL